MHKVNVYDCREYLEDIVARVQYNDCLDYWDGNNFVNGGVGMHKGLTKLRDGRYVIIIGSQWQGSKDYAYVVSAKEALEEILRSGNEDLLELKKYADLKELSESLAQEV